MEIFRKKGFTKVFIKDLLSTYLSLFLQEEKDFTFPF